MQTVIDSDDNDPERAWPDLDTAIKELQEDGWQVAEGPVQMPPDPQFAELERFETWGYRLRRSVQ